MFVQNLAGTTMLTLLMGSAAFAAPETVAPPSSASLSRGQIAQATRTDSVTIPTPGELFSALSKTTKPDWAGR
jgi:hypothetical protein